MYQCYYLSKQLDLTNNFYKRFGRHGGEFLHGQMAITFTFTSEKKIYA